MKISAPAVRIRRKNGVTRVFASPSPPASRAPAGQLQIARSAFAWSEAAQADVFTGDAVTARQRGL